MLNKLSIYIKNGNFEKILKTKSDPSIHQNAFNLHHLKNFLGGARPRTPLASSNASLILGFNPIKKVHIHFTFK